ncbi:nucleoside hydrolase [Brevibacillus antibioticus]|uniref:Nucleoside hydrolase n=1 Tax=Brevibacillus antibioticus TaxID=2570228 RepID=A0A4U2Y9V2_9BACL|nr:nucleoside hydrolase [Brevibacillus antibioticus]TKI56702.1 nucleoside hydrolase [Brevibacillus antibioticus]
MAKKHRLIIEFCGGFGQGLALLYALRSPDVQVAGIICRDTQSSLVGKLIEFAQPGYEIPIVTGAKQPLFSGTVEKTTSEGVRLLTGNARDEESDLTLVTFDRLTTLALAVTRDPLLARKFTRIVVQGGAIRVPGDVTAIAETNMHGDPEAAAVVLAARLPLVLVPLDTTGSFRLKEEQVHTLGSFAQAVGLIDRTTMSDVQFTTSARVLHACVAMLAALSPDKSRTEEMKLSVECKSEWSRGAILADLRAKPSVGTDTTVCVEVEMAEAERFLQTVLDQGGV